MMITIFPDVQSGPDLHALMAALFAGTGDNMQVKAAIGFQEAMETEG